MEMFEGITLRGPTTVVPLNPVGEPWVEERPSEVVGVASTIEEAVRLVTGAGHRLAAGMKARYKEDDRDFGRVLFVPVER